jgi:hypothetical protein
MTTSVSRLNKPVSLQKNDVVGRKLVRVLQTYEVLEGGIHFAENYFVLDSGIAFTFPFDAEADFTNIEIPDDADDIRHPAINEVLGSTIIGVYRTRRDDAYFEADDVIMRLDRGLWVWQVSSAPEGAHGSVGVYFEREPPEPNNEMVDYWSVSGA